MEQQSWTYDNEGFVIYGITTSSDFMFYLQAIVLSHVVSLKSFC